MTILLSDKEIAMEDVMVPYKIGKVAFVPSGGLMQNSKENFQISKNPQKTFKMRVSLS